MTYKTVYPRRWVISDNPTWKVGKTMLFSEWIRRVGFWGVDFLRGSKVRNHYANIRYIMENIKSPHVTKLQEGNLNAILKYATENVEFYKQYKGFDSIQSFPVINKNIIRNNYVSFHSPQFPEASVVNMTTSGSTGTPFVVRHDKNKRDRVYAEMIYFWGTAGYQVGMKYVMFRIQTSINKLTGWARNVLMWDIRKQDEENWENIRNTIRTDRKIKMLLSYGSILENLVNYLLTRGDTPEMYGIHTIISFGEALTRSAHTKLIKVFNCNVVSLYSDQEMGMLALECVENKEFHVNTASYVIELLKMDSDDPVGVGEPGRIVVTDLFNHAMPMIRYDTGDTAVWKQEAECDWGSQVFSSVGGQKADLIYDTRGNKLTPYNISVLLEPFTRLLQYQFIQENARQYVLKLNGAEGHYHDAAFVDMLKNLLGGDAEIAIDHVNEIPVLASGKRKEVVNNYIKKNV